MAPVKYRAMQSVIETLRSNYTDLLLDYHRVEADLSNWKQEALNRQEEVHRIRMCYPGGRGEELLSECELDLAQTRAELAALNAQRCDNELSS